MMNSAFVKCSSENLPMVDLDMLINYISSSELFRSAEMRGVKLKKSMRENYGDVAIGRVQLCRQQALCTVKAEVCPEQRVRNQNYNVTVIINETEESVVFAKCEDCAAAEGGCKHAVALLAWIYRKSEEPSPTSVECYWNKPLLSRVGSSIKYQELCNLNSKYREGVSENEQRSSDNFLESILSHPKSINCNSHLILFHRPGIVQKMSIFHQAVNYTGNRKNVEDFKTYTAEFLTEENCKKVYQITKEQSGSKAWYEMRFGRITASILYQAAQCKTSDGSLVEKILGMTSADSLEIQRGRDLEPFVLKKVEEIIKKNYNESSVEKPGLLLKKEYPMLGASPDGITKNAVIEIKCPAKEKTIKNYCDEKGTITKKFKTQIQVQMMFSGKKTGYFCIADPNFETNKKVNVLKLGFEEKFTAAVVKKAVNFWDKQIFPLLMNYK